MNSFLALICWKVIQGRPQHSFSINITQNICKPALLRAVVGVPSGELSNNRQKMFPLLYDGEPEPWPRAIHCVQAAVKRKELAPSTEMWGHMLRCEGTHVTLIYKAVWSSCWKVRMIWSCGVFYPSQGEAKKQTSTPKMATKAKKNKKKKSHSLQL